jgi:TP901 family phage tail tape measure protein
VSGLAIELDLDTGRFDNKIDSIPGRVASMGSKLTRALMGATVAAGGLALALGSASVAAASDFESAMANVNTVLDSKSGVGIEKLKQGLLGLDPLLGSSTELAEGLYQALSSGIDPGKSVRFVGDAAKLAKAGLADMGSTVKALTGFMNAYGDSTKSSAEVSDMMFKTVQLGVVELPELAAGLGNIASTAAAAGASQQEVLAAIAATTVKGVPAMQTMTALRQALANMIEPSKECAKAAAAMGLEGFGPSMLKAKGFSGTLEEIARATGGDVAKINALFGSVEAAGIITALAAEKSKKYKEALDGVGHSAGAVDRAFKMQTDTLKARLGGLWNAINQQLINLGTPLLPHLKRMLEQATQFVSRAPEHFKVIQEQARVALAEAPVRLSEAWIKGRDMAIDAWKTVPGWVKGLVAETMGIFTTFETSGRQLASGMKATWGEVSKFMGETFHLYGEGQQAEADLRDGLEGTLNLIRDTYGEIETIVDGLLGTLKDVSKFVKDLIADLSQVAGASAAAFGEASQGNFGNAVIALGGSKEHAAAAEGVASVGKSAAGGLSKANYVMSGGWIADAGAAGAEGLKSLLGFRTGGSFTVDGSGGVDSSVVAFKATPGEEVSVRRPGDPGLFDNFGAGAKKGSTNGGTQSMGSIMNAATAFGGGGLFGWLEKGAKEATHKGVEDGARSGSKAGVGKGNKGKKDEGLFNQMFSGASSALVDGLMSGDVKGGIKGFAKGLADSAKSMLKQALMQALGQKIFKSLFGGGIGGFLAGGGPVQAGVDYVVGEDGPEIFRSSRPGTIIPNHQINQAASGGSSVVFRDCHFNFSPAPGASGQQSFSAFMKEFEAYGRSGLSGYLPKKIQAAT